MRGSTVEVKCANKSCGEIFTARVADRKRGWGKFCSKSCKAIKQERSTGQMSSYLARKAGCGHGGNFIIGASEDEK